MSGGGHTLGSGPEHVLGGFLDGVAAIVLFALMALTCVDVVSREIFNIPLPATDLTRIAMGIVVFGALPSTTIREQHVCVDLLDAVTPSRIVNAKQGVIIILSAVLLGLASWQVGLRAEEALFFNDQSEFLRVPLWPVYLYISIMLGLATLALLVVAIRYARDEGALSPGRISRRETVSTSQYS